MSAPPGLAARKALAWPRAHSRDAEHACAIVPLYPNETAAAARVPRCARALRLARSTKHSHAPARPLEPTSAG